MDVVEIVLMVIIFSIIAAVIGLVIWLLVDMFNTKKRLKTTEQDDIAMKKKYLQLEQNVRVNQLANTKSIQDTNSIVKKDLQYEATLNKTELENQIGENNWNLQQNIWQVQDNIARSVTTCNITINGASVDNDLASNILTINTNNGTVALDGGLSTQSIDVNSNIHFGIEPEDGTSKIEFRTSSTNKNWVLGAQESSFAAVNMLNDTDVNSGLIMDEGNLFGLFPDSVALYTSRANIAAKDGFNVYTDSAIFYNSSNDMVLDPSGSLRWDTYNGQTLPNSTGISMNETAYNIFTDKPGINMKVGASTILGMNSKGVDIAGDFMVTGKSSMGELRAKTFVSEESINNGGITLEGRGFSAVNFNGSRAGQTDANKSRWRLFADQIATSDVLGIDQLVGSQNISYVTMSNNTIDIKAGKVNVKSFDVQGAVRFPGNDGKYHINGTSVMANTPGSQVTIGTATASAPTTKLQVLGDSVFQGNVNATRMTLSNGLVVTPSSTGVLIEKATAPGVRFGISENNGDLRVYTGAGVKPDGTPMSVAISVAQAAPGQFKDVVRVHNNNQVQVFGQFQVCNVDGSGCRTL